MDVAGMDVSWMTHGAPKDKPNRQNAMAKTVSSTSGPPAPEPPMAVVTPTSSAPSQPTANTAQAPAVEAPPPPPISTRRITFGKNGAPNNAPAGPGAGSRRGSWLQSVASKFGSSNSPQNQQQQQQQQPQSQPADTSSKQTKDGGGAAGNGAPASKSAPNKPHGETDPHGQPARSSQPGVLGGFLRRFSTSGGVLGSGIKGNHGIVERRMLNVDRGRPRCPIQELPDARLRKVAFCVDVEVAPQPRYVEADEPLAAQPALNEKTKKRMEKGEAAALKDPKAVEAQKEADGVVKSTGEPLPREPAAEGNGAPSVAGAAKDKKTRGGPDDATTPTTADGGNKKKEKRRRNEEERKVRKEKKRRQAEASGSIPVEIHGDSSDSSRPDTPVSKPAPKPVQFSMSNPVRIYRRCCQLRESHILKKITEQLSDPSNFSAETGLVSKLDLTGYWLQLDDLRTLGDYLAVVAVREVVLENCGITDEGLRCVLSGLLAAKRPEAGRKRITSSVKKPRPQSGGMVERLVLKSNDIGVDGWKHICLFINMCQSIRFLDLSNLRFPQPPPTSPRAGANAKSCGPLALAQLLSRSLGERLAGSNLELLNLAETLPTTAQLGVILDGVLKCGVRRLGLANNGLDAAGIEHVARYLSGGTCIGLDLSGNDLGGQLRVLATSINKRNPVWALSMADCGLAASDMGALLPVLAQLEAFRFLDISHNQDLCQTEPSSIALLRKYLPKLRGLKRIHLADVAMTYEQAVCLIEILPDITDLNCIKLSGNAALVKLADAQNDQEQEEACALYASLLTATKLSQSIVLVDIEVPSEQSSDVVKAMAKQVVAYCLRNMERLPVAEGGSGAAHTPAMNSQNESVDGAVHARVPNVMYDLVDLDAENDGDEPDDAYMIGGTGVAKALHCFLNNNHVAADSRRPSGEFTRGDEGPVSPIFTSSHSRIVPPTKAKELSKQLLTGARKIRTRIQPALARASTDPEADQQHFRRLEFLDQTLQSIINRFEDEFPETRLPSSPPLSIATTVSTQTSQNPAELALPPSEDEDIAPLDSGGGNGGVLNIRPLSRTNSTISQTSRAHVEEEGRAHRAGHRLRQGIFKLGPEHYDMLLTGVEEVAPGPLHLRMLEGLLDELGPEIGALKAEKGAVGTFKEHRELIQERMRDVDPDHWRLFKESQEKARANLDGQAVA